MNTQIKVHTRWMIRRDIPSVLELEAMTGGNWDEKDILEKIKKRATIGMVAEHLETIAGFFVYTAYASHIRVENFRVHPDFQRCSVGTQMHSKLMGKLDKKKTKLLYVVPDSHLEMHLFLRSVDVPAVKVLGSDYRFVAKLR